MNHSHWYFDVLNTTHHQDEQTEILKIISQSTPTSPIHALDWNKSYVLPGYHMSRCDEYKRESQTPRALKLSSALLRLRLSSLLLELPFSIDCPSPGGSTYFSLVVLRTVTLLFIQNLKMPLPPAYNKHQPLVGRVWIVYWVLWWMMGCVLRHICS